MAMVNTLLRWRLAFKVMRSEGVCCRCRLRQCHSIFRRQLQTESTPVPLRKQLKDEAKRRKKESRLQPQTPSAQGPLEGWELTVGIEIHARLNTERKLFSSAISSNSSEPNEHIASFDAALPGSQPQLQRSALIPAIRAALVLGCDVQRQSAWDRKHYFYQDQPNGYQITQYYEPFAKNGILNLTPLDGVPPPETSSGALAIGIKQVQLEQDTAKTTQSGASSSYLIDYSRVGSPLIEIITLPQIHSPATAAAAVRKIRDLLRLVDACSGNMESGDLRADVNVSVRRAGGSDREAGQSYAGVTGLGTRTEIKNLNSFRAVEEAVAAERDRQVRVLGAGGTVVGETRGWSVGGTETTRLRSKEGEVDYRYMPDPDLGPVYIDTKLVEDLRRGLPEMPEATLERIRRDFDLSMKDAVTLLSLDDGERLEFAAETRDFILDKSVGEDGENKKLAPPVVGRAAANWVLHEIGGLLTGANQEWLELRVQARDLAAILDHLLRRQITGRVAKQLLQTMFTGENGALAVDDLIHQDNLLLRPMSDSEYEHIAQTIIDDNPDAVAAIKEKGQKGKIMFLVGQIMRRADEGTAEAEAARKTIERLLHV